MCRVEQATGSGLLNKPVEDIVDDVFEIGKKPVNSVSDDGLLSPSSTDETVLEFSCDWTCPIDILVVAVRKPRKRSDGWRIRV